MRWDWLKDYVHVSNSGIRAQRLHCGCIFTLFSATIRAKRFPHNESWNFLKSPDSGSWRFLRIVLPIALKTCTDMPRVGNAAVLQLASSPPFHHLLPCGMLAALLIEIFYFLAVFKGVLSHKSFVRKGNAVYPHFTDRELRLDDLLGVK